MRAKYELHLYSNTGVYLKTVTKKSTRVEYNPHVNDRGEFRLSFSSQLTPEQLASFQLNGRVAVWRKATSFETAKLEFVGFVRHPHYKTDDRGITRFWIRGWDQNDLLYTRCCRAWLSTWHPFEDGYIDTVMRKLVEDNLGAGNSNPSTRDIATSNTAGLTFAVESSATATACTTAGQISYEHGVKNLLEALQELAKTSEKFKQIDVGTAAVRVFFGICTDTDTSWTFRVRATRWGMNHRADSGQPVYIGMSYGNLRLPEWEHDRMHEITAAVGIYFARDYSLEGWATDDKRIGEAPLNRREASASASDGQQMAVASALVTEGEIKERFRGFISDTAGCRYGVHWGLGDEVSIDHLDRQFNVMVTGIRIECERGRERIEPTWEVIEDE